MAERVSKSKPQEKLIINFRDLTIAGTNVQFLAANSSLPVLILKDYRQRDYYLDRSYRFGVCIDGSPQSKKALKTALSIMQKQDKIVVITVNETLVEKTQGSNVHADVDKIAAQFGCKNLEKVVLDHPKSLSVYKTI